MNDLQLTTKEANEFYFPQDLCEEAIAYIYKMGADRGTLLLQVDELKQKVKDREKELYRVRVHETQAAHELDAHHDHESRAKFKDTCDLLAEVSFTLDKLLGK